MFTIEQSFDSINDNWVLGLTTSDEYRNFSIMERKIIKMYYIDEKSDQDIANEMGTCRATINRRRLRVKEKLRETLKNANKISR